MYGSNRCGMSWNISSQHGKKGYDLKVKIAMTSSEIEYIKPVYPGETVFVQSEKQYFRFNKLKCRVKMFDSEKNLVCKGIIAGMIIKNKNQA